MERPAPRLTSVMGVARALLSTVTPGETVEILVGEFGWDQTFQALALLRGGESERAFALTWEHLLTGPVDEELRRRSAGPRPPVPPHEGGGA